MVLNLIGSVVSGVPQSTVLGPLLFSLHINDITGDIESEIRLFADDCVCYREIKDIEETLKFCCGSLLSGKWLLAQFAVCSLCVLAVCGFGCFPFWFLGLDLGSDCFSS